MAMNIFNADKPIKLPSSLVRECIDYLNGKLVSAELMAQIKNIKDQDPTISKTEIVEYILDHQERELRKIHKP